MSEDSLNLGSLVRQVRQMSFDERVAHGGKALGTILGAKGAYLRRLESPNDREVMVWDSERGKAVPMVMFANNSYLGLTNHPLIRERVIAIVNEWGTGLAGGPVVCGYNKLIYDLEQRLAALKHAEAAMIFPTGYQANIGAITGLPIPQDTIIFDELSHSSINDAIRMSGNKAHRFMHNDCDDLADVLEREAGPNKDLFVIAEGVYSMDGDVAPLDEMVPLCKKHGAHLIVDDAHGTGVLGKTGAGTSEHFGVTDDVAVNVMTFSKTLGAIGGAVTGSQDLINYLRYFASSFVFSTAPNPPVIGAVHGALDVLEREPDRVVRLRENVKYLVDGLARIGIEIECPAAIAILRTPRGMNLREASRKFEDAGLFVGVVEYPAVAVNQQRFRITMMSTHTKNDIDRLLACVEELWEPYL